MAELQDIASRIASWARDGEQVEAYVSRFHENEVMAFGGDVESLSSASSEGVGVRVIVDRRLGFAYSASLDEAALGEALEEARDNAAFGTPDEALGLATPDGVEPSAVDPWSDDVAPFPSQRRVELALELERLVRDADPRIQQVQFATYADVAIETAVATSTGVVASNRRTSAYVNTAAVASDGDSTEIGSGYSVRRSPLDLDLEEAAADAVRRATALLGAKKPSSSAHVPVVFDPRVTQILLAVLSDTLSGENVQKQRSMFADRVGEQVASADFVLVDDPTDPDAYGAVRFDAEGLACRRNVLIDGGVLRGFLYNTHAARRAGTTSTASAVRSGFKSIPGISVRALSLVPGALSQDEILAEVGDAVFVESVQGVNSGVNAVSGDFSVGAAGFMVRDGQRAEPVREFTIASTLQRMLLDVVAIGSDLEWLPSPVAGVTVAIGDMALSGA